MDVQQLEATLAAQNEHKPVGDWAGKPAIPASTVGVTNTSKYNMWVEVVAGTVTVVSVDGTTTGRVVGAFLLRPGSEIKMTYSVAPTWHWFAL